MSIVVTLSDAAAAAKLLQSRLTLCSQPIDGSPPGFPIPGILQARTLEWVAISFSNAWKWKVKVKLLSRVRHAAIPRTAANQAPPSMDFPGKSTGVGCHCLLWPWVIDIVIAILTVCLRELDLNRSFAQDLACGKWLESRFQPSGLSDSKVQVLISQAKS